jgi:undecaprenyl phosphate N,N'-diacetylbacillosamine 1-phosphate transferase
MKSILKRLLDLAVSATGLAVLLLLFLMIAGAIKIDSPGPVFFRQERAGKEGKIFKIFKFRTMVVDAEKKGSGVFVKENDFRITKVGKLLRQTSLDELPQLLNVLKGEMSLVGPRPALPYQVDHYDNRQRRRLTVQPGITGWAQVNGRTALSWPERIELDLWYLDHWSILLDLKIILQTIAVVLAKKGIYKPDYDDPISGRIEDNEPE